MSFTLTHRNLETISVALEYLKRIKPGSCPWLPEGFLAPDIDEMDDLIKLISPKNVMKEYTFSYTLLVDEDEIQENYDCLATDINDAVRQLHSSVNGWDEYIVKLNSHPEGLPSLLKLQDSSFVMPCFPSNVIEVKVGPTNMYLEVVDDGVELEFRCADGRVTFDERLYFKDYQVD